jgi:hypothetical protein
MMGSTVEVIMKVVEVITKNVTIVVNEYEETCSSMLQQWKSRI